MSWEQLLDIGRQAAQTVEQERAAPPVDCPRDGTTLQTDSAGVAGCPFCGWRSDTTLGENCP